MYSFIVDNPPDATASDSPKSETVVLASAKSSSAPGAPPNPFGRDTGPANPFANNAAPEAEVAAAGSMAGVLATRSVKSTRRQSSSASRLGRPSAQHSPSAIGVQTRSASGGSDPASPPNPYAAFGPDAQRSNSSQPSANPYAAFGPDTQSTGGAQAPANPYAVFETASELNSSAQPDIPSVSSVDSPASGANLYAMFATNSSLPASPTAAATSGGGVLSKMPDRQFSAAARMERQSSTRSRAEDEADAVESAAALAAAAAEYKQLRRKSLCAPIHLTVSLSTQNASIGAEAAPLMVVLPKS